MIHKLYAINVTNTITLGQKYETVCWMLQCFVTGVSHFLPLKSPGFEQK